MSQNIVYASPSAVMIPNVLQFKLGGRRVAYLGYFRSSQLDQLVRVKRFDDTSGEGYQRPLEPRRAKRFADYMMKSEAPVFSPILLQAGGEWLFDYDRNFPNANIGRLTCNAPAYILDGQHRLEGIRKYMEKTRTEIQVPFMAIHDLDQREEVKSFLTVNTEAKLLSKSLGYYLTRNEDEWAGLASELIQSPDSPFHQIGTISGKRTAQRHVTTQNLYKAVNTLFKWEHVQRLPMNTKEQILNDFFSMVSGLFSTEWGDFKNYQITHSLGINALAEMGMRLLALTVDPKTGAYDPLFLRDRLERLRGFDWSSEALAEYKGAKGVIDLSILLMNHVMDVNELEPLLYGASRE